MSVITVKEALKLGEEAHALKNYQLADRYYTAILKSNPQHPRANYLMGRLALDVGKQEIAPKYLGNCFSIERQNYDCFKELITTLIKLKNFRKAEQFLEEAKQFEHKDDYQNLCKKIVEEESKTKETTTIEDDIAFLKSLAAKQDFEKALQYSQELILSGKHHPEVYNIQGAVQFNLKYIDQAELSYKAALKLDHKFAKSHNNLGVLYLRIGKIKEAEKCFVRAIEIQTDFVDARFNLANTLATLKCFDSAVIQYEYLIKLRPKDPKYIVSLAVVFVHKKQLKTAENLLRTATKLQDNYFDAHHNLGILLGKLSKNQDALKSLHKARTLDQNNPEVYFNLANVLKQDNKAFEAIEHYKMAIDLKPEYVSAHLNVSNLLREMGELDAALYHCNKVIEIEPNFAQGYNNLGIIYKDLGDLDAATRNYKAAIKIDKNFAGAHNNLGILQGEIGLLNEAIISYQNVLSIEPDNVEALNNLGLVFHNEWDIDTAIEYHKKAVSVDPLNAMSFYNLASALHLKGDLENAKINFVKALEIKPNYAQARNNLGVIYQALGETELSIKNYEAAIQLKPDYCKAHRQLSTIKKYTPESIQLSKMKVLESNGNLTDDEHCEILFAIAKAHDDFSDYEKAFQYYKKANSIRKEILSYNLDKDVQKIEKIKALQGLTPVVLKDIDCKQSVTPIFILGMPRSGTTLVEQVLSNHHEVSGAGELTFVQQLYQKLIIGYEEITDNILMNFREQYLKKVKDISKGKRYVTDKMPSNFLYINLIRNCFPEAKIVHVKRDAGATCWSNFTQFFVTRELGYTYDLKDVAEYYSLYEDLMIHWEAKFPGDIATCDYDALTINPQIEITKLLSMINLPWDDNCLRPETNNRSVNTASQQQIRKPIYKGSSEKWHNYKPYLEGIFDLIS